MAEAAVAAAMDMVRLGAATARVAVWTEGAMAMAVAAMGGVEVEEGMAMVGVGMAAAVTRAVVVE